MINIPLSEPAESRTMGSDKTERINCSQRSASPTVASGHLKSASALPL